MDEVRFSMVLGTLIVPNAVGIIIGGMGMGAEDAIGAFYRSETYAMLSDQRSSVWHLSPRTIFRMWE